MFVVSGDGNPSTFSSARRQKRLQLALRVPTLHWVAVSRHLKPRWYYERGSVLWPRELPWNASVGHLVVMTDTREGQIRVGTNVP